MEYEQHPLGQLMPEMSKDEFEELCASVDAVGPLEPILLYQQQVLDHWHLYKACQKSGKTPQFREYSGSDPLGYIEAVHTRRHLVPFQRSLLAVRLMNERTSRGMPKTQAAKEVSHLVHVSPKSMAQAEAVQKNGSADLKHHAINGTIPLGKAAAISKLPKTEQKRAVASAKKNKKPAPSVMRDDEGNEVPANLKDAFADKTIYEIRAYLLGAIGKVKQIAMWNTHVLLGKATAALLEAASALDHAPSVVHQKCGGQGCKACLQCGFMPKHAADSESLLESQKS